jgi:hypothetical protein
LGEKYLAKIRERQASVEDVFNDEDVLALYRLIKILDQFDSALGALSLAIAGNGHEVERGIDGD